MPWKKGNNKKGWLQRVQKLKVLFVYVHCQTSFNNYIIVNYLE